MLKYAKYMAHLARLIPNDEKNEVLIYVQKERYRNKDAMNKS
jgi:hypothetical protein